MSAVTKVRGIFYGWWMVFTSCFMFMTAGGIASYGFTAFFNPILTEMNWTRAETSLAFSLRSVEGGVMMPIIGFFIDRLGARRCIILGVVLMGIALFWLSRISSLFSFYGAFLLMALAHTTGFGLAQQTVVMNWFKKRRSLAMGVLTAGYGVSGAMTPFLVLLIHSYGWRNSLAILSPVVIAIGFPIAMMIRHRPEPYGYLPDGEKAADPAPQSDTAQTATNHREDSHSGTTAGVPEGPTIKECIATSTFWLLILYTVFMGFAQSAIMVHIMPALISVQIPENIAALAVTGMTTSSLVGRLGFSWLADIYGKRRILTIAAAMVSIGVFIFANISASWMIIPFLFFYGPGFGATIPLLPALQADCFGTRTFATLRGLMMIGFVIPGIFAPFIAGWVYDLQGSYRLTFTAFAALCALAIPVMMRIRLPAQGAAEGTLNSPTH
ncbi:MAG: MFS transporter [Chloroflexota bacterium]